MHPEHIVGTKTGVTERDIRRLEPTKRLETSLLLEIQGVPCDLVPSAPRRGRRKIHPTPAPSCRQSTETRQIRPLKRQHIFVVIIRHGDCSSSCSNRFQKPTAENDVRGATLKAHARSSTQTKRAAESMTLDVPPQAQHPRGEDSQMDFRNVTAAVIPIAGNEDEDPAEHSVDHEGAENCKTLLLRKRRCKPS